MNSFPTWTCWQVLQQALNAPHLKEHFIIHSFCCIYNVALWVSCNGEVIIPLWFANLKYYQLETINGSCSGSQECLYYQVTHSNPPYQCHCTSNNESLSHVINTCTQTLNLLLEMKFQPRIEYYAMHSMHDLPTFQNHLCSSTAP